MALLNLRWLFDTQLEMLNRQQDTHTSLEHRGELRGAHGVITVQMMSEAIKSDETI